MHECFSWLVKGGATSHCLIWASITRERKIKNNNNNQGRVLWDPHHAHTRTRGRIPVSYWAVWLVVTPGNYVPDALGRGAVPRGNSSFPDTALLEGLQQHNDYMGHKYKNSGTILRVRATLIPPSYITSTPSSQPFPPFQLTGLCYLTRALTRATRSLRFTQSLNRHHFSPWREHVSILGAQRLL